jgi:hypothetical protein
MQRCLWNRKRETRKHGAWAEYLLVEPAVRTLRTDESAWLAEWPWQALWHVGFMGGWLHLGTLFWGFLLIVSGYSLAPLCRWVNSPHHAEQLYPEPRLRGSIAGDWQGKKLRWLDPSRSSV